MVSGEAPSQFVEGSITLSRSLKRWSVLFICCLLSLSANSGYLSFTAISSITRKYYHITVMKVNALAIVYEFLFLPLTLPFSLLIEKQGLRFTIVLCSLLNVCGATLRFIGKEHTGYIFLLTGSVFSASALVGTLLLPSKIAAVWFGPEERGLATGIAVSADSAGMALGFFQASLLVRIPKNATNENFNFHSFLLTQAGISIFSFALAILFAEDKPESPPSLSQAYLSHGSNLPLSKLEISVQDLERIKIPDKQITSIRCGTVQAVDVNSSSQDLHPSWENTTNLMQGLMSLLLNRHFLVILHINALSFALDGQLLVFLNEILIPKYPKREITIGLMGGTMILCGAIGNICIGRLLDYTKRYKHLTTGIFAITLFLLILFSALFVAGFNLEVIFVLLCLVEFVMASYFTVAFEQSAEVTYPAPEAMFSALLILTAEGYSFVFSLLGTMLLPVIGESCFLIITHTLALGALCLSFYLQDVHHRTVVDQMLELTQ